MVNVGLISLSGFTLFSVCQFFMVDKQSGLKISFLLAVCVSGKCKYVQLNCESSWHCKDGMTCYLGKCLPMGCQKDMVSRASKKIVSILEPCVNSKLKWFRIVQLEGMAQISFATMWGKKFLG